MRRTGYIAAALVAALPFVATTASAQLERPGATAPAARAAPAAPAGGGGGAMVPRGGGGGGGRVGVSPGGGVASGPSIGPVRGYYPQAGWSQPGPQGYRQHHRHHRHVFGPSVYFGSAYAAQPYYYDDYSYQEEPYVGIVPGGSAPDEVAYCQQRYRSYDVRTGTYLNNDGNRYPCP